MRSNERINFHKFSVVNSFNGIAIYWRILCPIINGYQLELQVWRNINLLHQIDSITPNRYNPRMFNAKLMNFEQIFYFFGLFYGISWSFWIPWHHNEIPSLNFFFAVSENCFAFSWWIFNMVVTSNIWNKRIVPHPFSKYNHRFSLNSTA